MADIKTIDDENFAGKKVLVRVDFNAPVDADGNVTDDTRIRAALPTINKLVGDGARVILTSHRGRPAGEGFEESFSLGPIARRLQELLGRDIVLSRELIGPAAQEAVDALEAKGETVIFLAYGLCGRGLTGVTGHTATLILPRVHDCIPVLLGATQEQANESSLGGGTYWLSPGWLRYSQTSFIQNREKRFKEYEERFGTDSAAYLIELEGSWLRNYTNACLILWEGWEDERELVRTAKAVADDAGLGYRELPGDPNFIQALLEGGKDGRFLRIAPGFTPDLDGNGTITAVRVTS